MAGIKRKTKSRIQLLWLVTCVILLVLPLCANLIEYAIFSRKMNEQIAERNNFALKTVKNSIDEDLLYAESLSIRLANDADLREIITSVSLPVDANDKHKLYHFVNEFDYSSGVEDYSERIYIYVSHLDYMIKINSAQPMENFYDTYLKYGDMSKEEWINFANEYHDGIYFTMNFDEAADELFYIKTVELSYNDSVVNVIFNLDKQSISSAVSELYLPKYGQLYVLDHNGNTVLKLGEAEGKNSALLTYECKSQINGWKYIYQLPKDIVYQDINRSKGIILVLLFGVFMLCLIIVRQFLKFNREKANQLMSFFGKEEKPAFEFSSLKKNIENSLEENDQLRRQVKNQSKWLKDNVLVSLLEGKEISDKHTLLEMENMGFDFSSKAFAVVLYSLKNKASKDADTTEFAINNVFCELLSQYGYTFTTTNYKDNIVYVISSDDEKMEENVLDAMHFANDFLKETFYFELYGAIGCPHKSKGGIAESYHEAKQTLDYCIALKKTGIEEYKTIKEKLMRNYFYSQEMEDRLLNLIKSNDGVKLHSTLEEIFLRNETEGHLSLNSARFLVVNMFNTIKRFLSQYGVKVEEFFSDECRMIENIFKNESTEEIKSTILSIYENCYDRILKKLKMRDDIASRIVEYIRENYQNQMMGVQMVADAFSLSRDYVARQFKEKTNIRINDYINEVRVEKAKEYLKETNNLVSVIAMQVGFSNYRTFVRIFTNVTGVSPKQYRENNKQNNGGNNL